MDPAISICVAVVSHNDGDLLESCLASAQDADELIVLDMESTDATCFIAESFGATVCNVPLSPIAERIRQRVHQSATSEWILHLDPDEQLPANWLRLARECINADSRRFGGYRAEYLDYAFDRPLHHLSRGVGKISLVARKGTRWSDSAPAHSAPDLARPVGSLVGRTPPIRHYSLRSVAGATDKIARYSATGGSSAARAPDDPWALPKMLRQSIIDRQAWRDGPEGLIFVTLIDVGNFLGLLRQAETQGMHLRRIRTTTRLTLTVLKRLYDARAALVHLRRRVMNKRR